MAVYGASCCLSLCILPALKRWAIIECPVRGNRRTLLWPYPGLMKTRQSEPVNAMDAHDLNSHPDGPAYGVLTAADGADFRPTPFTAMTRYSCASPALASLSTNRSAGTGASGVSWYDIP